MEIVPIEDATDPRLVDYRQLRDVRARRAIEGDEFFIAEGPVAIERLLESDHRVRSVLLSDRKLDRLSSMLAEHDVTVFVADRALLGDIVGFDLHRGAIAAADRHPVRSVDSIVESCERVAIVEGINDPENIGLVMRSARALHIDGMILDPTCFDPYNRRSVRVSMGESLHVPFARADDWPGAAFDRLHAAGFETWAMTPADDAVGLWSLDPPRRLAVVFGAEGPGLSRTTLSATTRRVAIPIRDEVDSLNVAAAAAVTFAAISRP